MTGIDANVLVALAAESHPDHAGAVTAFDRELAANEEIALSFSVAAEFLHVVTDSRRMVPALEMGDAVRWLRDWTAEVMPVWLAPDGRVFAQWLKWMDEFQLGRKRILDTQFAALLYTNGARRLLTNNAADFRVFGVFEIMGF